MKVFANRTGIAPFLMEILPADRSRQKPAHFKHFSMPPQKLYLFKVRDTATSNWRQTRYRLTVEIAREQYGEGNYELIEDSGEFKGADSAGLCMPHLARNPGAT